MGNRAAPLMFTRQRRACGQRAAYGGRLFDVLGEAFTQRSLRDLLIEAIRYGDDPARQAENERIIDTEITSLGR